MIYEKCTYSRSHVNENIVSSSVLEYKQSIIGVPYAGGVTTSALLDFFGIKPVPLHGCRCTNLISLHFCSSIIVAT